METTTRNATLADLADILTEQHDRKLDVVTPATAIRSQQGILRIEGTDFEFDPTDGVRETPGTFRPTAVCDEGIADKLGVPVQYLKKMRINRPDLYDANVNGWLHGRSKVRHAVPNSGNLPRTEVIHPADERNFLIRTFRGLEGGTGIARAFLSNGYKIIDNLDVLTAALEGVEQAGAKIEIEGCDLTDRRMYVRIVAPEVTAMAPTLLEGYRSPFDQGIARAGHAETGPTVGDQGLPIVFAGFVLSNSETGGGAFTIVPRLVVQICRNGLTITKDATRAVHLGAKLDEGVVKWSEDTQTKNLELIAAKARDAVATFLDGDYMTKAISELEEKAARPVNDPAKTVTMIGQTLRFSEDRISGVLNHFIRGGQVNAGGVLNAVTSYAQTVDDADEAFDIENQAIKAFELAAR